MKKSKGDKRKKSPSRERYEARNPTVSGRVPKRTRDRLYANLAKQGMSLADALKVLAGELELKVRPIDEARQEAYDEGWEDGSAAAERCYAVSCPCSRCGKERIVTHEDEKQALRRFMMANQWHHGDCDNTFS